MQVVDQKDVKCFHCGETCHGKPHCVDKKPFCCSGCSSVYQLLNENQLQDYYKLQHHPGAPKSPSKEKFAYLDNDAIAQGLLLFNSDSLQKMQFHIPGIHCSSCIWLLEHLPRLHHHIKASRVNFPRKELTVDYDPRGITLRQLVELLAEIGYEPNISLENQRRQQSDKSSQQLLVKIGVAGFCFGNIMLLSFPEYLGLDIFEDQILTRWFSWIILLLSLPVVGYCAKDYFISAVKGLKQRYLNIDVPIVLGILALFGRSVYEITTGIGPGYLDSLAGLLFLLLIGKWFQQRTYRNLSFDRDFKAYFPLAVLKVTPDRQESVLVKDLAINDIILIRHEELVPTDCKLLDGPVQIDYSFVTGESAPVTKHSGDFIYAGGRHLGTKAHYQVEKEVSQSYLTQLWNHAAFKKEKDHQSSALINSISKYFTLVVLGIATLAAAFWLVKEPQEALFVFTSVLIVACPCALSMATPFTLGSVMRIMGLNKFYLKNAQVVEELAQIDTLIFDKTGTLTEPKGALRFQGKELTKDQSSWLISLTSQSTHPAAQDICRFLQSRYDHHGIPATNEFMEIPGVGISGTVQGHELKVGKLEFVGNAHSGTSNKATYLAIDKLVIGYFNRENKYRDGLSGLFGSLSKNYSLELLSGDGNYEAEKLLSYFPLAIMLHFDKSPMDKLQFIQETQQGGARVMMVGDGLNDAGALQQSEVGIAVTEDISHFTPASDAIIAGPAISKLQYFLKLSKLARWVIIGGFVLSFLYNIVGLSLAVSASLTPLAAAILMPLSSISVVVLTTSAVNIMASKLKLK